MASFRKPTKRPINKKNAQDAYSKYMLLALEMRATGDRTLFEDYYQRAEYYLHLMNKLSDVADHAYTVDRKITPTRYYSTLSEGVFGVPSGKALSAKAV